jgi:methanogenic corrinoid protein MtbC1
MANPHIELIQLLADLEEDAVLDLVRQRVAVGDDPLQIIEECNAGMRQVGERYEQRRYFLSGLIMAGEIFREVVEIVQPVIVNRTPRQSFGRVLLGTVQGDIHDIGKDMVGMLLTCHGFTVIDLGVDVPPAEFVKQVSEQKPDIVGLSGVLSSSYEMMRETVALLRAPAQPERPSIIIGGGTVDDQVCRYVGADYWVADAMSGVHLCQQLMAGH